MIGTLAAHRPSEAELRLRVMVVNIGDVVLRQAAGLDRVVDLDLLVMPLTGLSITSSVAPVPDRLGTGPVVAGTKW